MSVSDKLNAMPNDVVFLTGGTGNLGSRILARFLEDPSISFKLLVYAKDRVVAETQAKQAVEFWGKSWQEAERRIEVILGDIGREDLGFAPDTRERLAGEVTQIIHCAANFKLDLSLEEARSSIVMGTQHVAGFADLCRSKGNFRRFHSISTEEVAVSLSGEVKEEFLPLRESGEYFNTYEYAKAEAENWLREKRERDGFPITVYRPAIIVGDSKSGKIINAQGFYYIIRDMFLYPKTPFVPVNDIFQLDVIPVDCVAETLYAMHTDQETEGRVYHLSAGKEHFMTLREFLRSLQDIHHALTGEEIALKPFISPRLIFLLLSILGLFAWGSSGRSIRFQREFLRFFFVKASLSTASFRSYAEKKGIAIPELRSYLDTLYRYYYEHDLELASLQKSDPS